MTALPPSPAPDLTVLELGSAHEALLQRFMDANPRYYHDYYGEPPRPDEAHHELHEPLPEGWAYTKRWYIGYVDASGELVAFANIVSDLIAPRVWHIGFLVLAAEREATGLGRVLWAGLERWMREQGAEWLRLGVVAGNTRAERFWQANGFLETRIRENTPYRSRTQTMRVLYKPLTGGTLEEYRALIARDRPEA